MQHQITMPKSLGGTKAERKASVQTDGKAAWIATTEMLRVTGLKPLELLHTMPEFQLVQKLKRADENWPAIQAAYASSSESFEVVASTGGEYSKLILDLLQTNRRPADAVASMDTSMIEFLIAAQLTADSQTPPTPPQDTVCASCGATDPRLRCSACKEMACISVLYCTKACQLAHWKAHKKVCCKNRLAKPDADALQSLMQPESSDVKAKVALLQGIMEVCKGVE
jgi:hypothetical protein